jgi:DNA invertase Pin-like site-specific DNA recombinase
MKTAPRPDSDKTALAYSYVRFSTPEQRKGDSLRRQTEAAKAWCDAHGAKLDESTTLHDLGTLAFRGDHCKNPDRNALAGFLKLVENGRVPRGSYLVIESLDRLSREHIRPALSLLLSLIDAGVRIVQLKPVEMLYDEAVEPMQLMMALMELSHGNSESAMKSQRVGAAWDARRTHARDGRKLLTGRLPAWVTIEAIHADSFTLAIVPDHAKIIRRIFDLAIAGLGPVRIVRQFQREKVPAFGSSGKWNRIYVRSILVDRRVLGEFQPRSDGKPDGDVIKDYFPKVVSEEDFERAAGMAATRYFPEHGPTRQGKHADPFAGLVRDARDGASYTVTAMGAKGKSYRCLKNYNATEGRGQSGNTFPLRTFEDAVLSCLREIDPHEILNGDHGPDESLALAGQLASVEARIAEVEAELLANGDVAALARVLRGLESRKRELAAALAEARQKAAHPLSESWGEAQSLIELLNSAPDPIDARLRLRSALRRMVDVIYLLVVPRGSIRLAAVQIWFAGGQKHRDYLIVNKAAGYKRKGGWWTRSLPPDLATDLDLRIPTHAAGLAEALEAVDLDGV